MPKRLSVRPIDHSQADESGPDLDYAAEARRWFDYWLKSIDNGITREPPIHYYVIGAPKKSAWRASSRWPPQNQAPTRYYFGAGPTGSIASFNDGCLKTEAPAASALGPSYRVDYSATSGEKSRWLAINWTRDYPDMRANDAKGLTYTSAPLPASVEVVGHPVAHLWLQANVADLDAFVYLEDVNGNGKSSYITEGELRASHRKLIAAPFDNLGLPYHSHEQHDIEPISADQPIELVFNLLPTAYRFQQGNRIRVTVTFADTDNFETPVLEPAPSLRLLSDGSHPSFIEIPVSR